MTPREELTSFYESLKVRAPANFAEYSDLRGPDLIWLDDEYLDSSPRIAIVGKEQKGWDYNYPEFISAWNIPDAISAYREFDFGAKYYSSPFWQFFHAVRLSAFPDKPEARRKVLWTNLVKFVAADGSPILGKPYVEAALQLQQDVLTTELAIARPDICLFVTGHGYDSVLDRYFGNIHYEPLDLPVWQFARLVHPSLPRLHIVHTIQIICTLIEKGDGIRFFKCCRGNSHGLTRRSKGTRVKRRAQSFDVIQAA